MTFSEFNLDISHDVSIFSALWITEQIVVT